MRIAAIAKKGKVLECLIIEYPAAKQGASDDKLWQVIQDSLREGWYLVDLYKNVYDHTIGTATKEIIKAVVEGTGISYNQIRSKSRKREVCTARFILMKHLRDKSGMGLENIGAMCGGRDHSTVISALTQYDNLMEFDMEFAAVANRVNDLLNKKEVEV